MVVIDDFRQIIESFSFRLNIFLILALIFNLNLVLGFIGVTSSADRAKVQSSHLISYQSYFHIVYRIYYQASKHSHNKYKTVDTIVVLYLKYLKMKSEVCNHD